MRTELFSWENAIQKRGEFLASDGAMIELSYSNQIFKIDQMLKKRFIAGLEKIKTKIKNEYKAYHEYIANKSEFDTMEILLYKNELNKTDNLLKIYKDKFYG